MAINILEAKVYNRISAGEVVERPASIVKELVENSIDAGASEISIEIENGGKDKVQVADNGCGIAKEDLLVAFMPHATSKISKIEDLDSIASLGFRGEALASISSVCHVTLSSKTKDSDIGYSLKVDGGEFGKVEEVARQNGTTLVARDLFYNTPARAKFLRKSKSEEAEITHLVEKFMLSHPEIAFRYYVDGQLVYNTTSGVMQDIIYTIYGREVYDSLLPVDYQEEGYVLSGFITKPKISKSNRTFQTLFVNKRYVENYLISSAVQGVYESFLMKGKFPIYCLELTVPFNCVDVNVHPSKKEVKFENPSWIFGFVRRAIEKTLLASDKIAVFAFDDHKPMPDEFLSEYNSAEISQSRQNKQEPVSATEGSSYVTKIDHTEGITPIQEVALSTEPEEYVEKRTPALSKDFKNIKLPSERIPKNKPGNKLIYFDQPESGFAYEIMSKSERAADKSEETKATPPQTVKEDSFLTSSVADQMKILGTVFNTYIIVELDEDIYFLDQHAAHERLLYDRLVKQINEGGMARQDLLLAFDFSLSPHEALSMERVIDGLQKMGFVIDCKGGFKYQIKAVPLVLSNISLKDFVDEIVKESVTFEKKPSEFVHNKLCQSACKHAIKGGDPISKDSCAYLIEQVRKGVMLCPHGRPVVLRLSKKELEKMFGRIV